MTRTFRGDCMGVRLEPRAPADQHVLVVVEIEDDGNWHEKLAVSSFWLDELIAQLQAARKACVALEPDMHEGRQYCWKFKTLLPVVERDGQEPTEEA